MKTKWINPLIYNNPETSSGEWTGHGSGQSTPDIEPYDYEMWCILFEDFPDLYDMDKSNGPGEWSDYVAWMTENGFEDYIRE